MFKQFVPSFSKLPAEEVMKQMKDSDLEAFQRMNNRYRSGKGFLLDLEHTSKQFHHLLTAIQSPTLILHSLNDQAVSLEHAHHAKNQFQHQLFVSLIIGDTCCGLEKMQEIFIIKLKHLLKSTTL